MKNNIITVCCMLLLGLTSSCDRDSDPSASGLDTERLKDSLALNYPLVREYYENRGVAILHRFDEIVDLKFDFHNAYTAKFWDGLSVGKITGTTELDSVMHILENDILSCFKTGFTFDGQTYSSDFVKNYFPPKIILTDNLVSTWGASLSIPTESVNRTSETLQGTLHGTINNNAVVMNLNPKVMCSSEANFQRFRKDILYFTIAYLIDKHNLYDRISDRFYAYSREFYGKEIRTLLEDTEEEVPEFMSKTEYIERFGILLSSVYPSEKTSFSTYTKVTDRKRDVRLYLDQLLNAESFEAGGEPVWKMTAVTQQKMWYLGHALLELGIDVSEIIDDPDLSDLLKMPESELINIEIP